MLERDSRFSVVIGNLTVSSVGSRDINALCGTQSDCKCGVRVFFRAQEQQRPVRRLVLVQERRRWHHVDSVLCGALCVCGWGPGREVITICGGGCGSLL